MAPKLIIGADPGLSGGLAILNAETLELIAVHDMPVRYVHERAPKKRESKYLADGKTLRKKKPAKKQSSRKCVDATALARLLAPIKDQIAAAWVEKVSVRPGEGAVGAFGFGWAYGSLIGVLEALGLPVCTVMPSCWKKHHGLLKTEKEEAAAMAETLYPHINWRSPRAKNLRDGIGDATMIALYGAAAHAIKEAV